MRRYRLMVALLAALCLLGSLGALAATPRPTLLPGPTRAIEDAGFAVPEPPRCFYVLDEAGVLSEETKSSLYFTSQVAYDQYEVQLVVVTVDSTNGVEIGDYAYTLYNQWGIGTMKRASGLLLLMAVEDGDYCVVEGPDHQLDYYLLTWLQGQERYFKAGQYGLFAGNFSNKYTLELLERSDAFPQRGDYESILEYRVEMQQAQSNVTDAARRAKADWKAAGGDWNALTAEGGGGRAYREVRGRRSVLEMEDSSGRERRPEQPDEAAARVRMEILKWIGIILLAAGLAVIIVIDLRHGGHFTVFLLHVIVEALAASGSDSGSRGSHGGGGGRSGGGGHSSGGGGGSFSGGGAGRGR